MREHYGVNRIRAVLVQAPTTKRAELLRKLVGDPLVCGKAPSPLFWFTHVGYFDKLLDIDDLDGLFPVPAEILAKYPNTPTVAQQGGQ